MPSVSYVIPVFNKSKFLKPVIDSLKSQKGDFQKEYIFIDDGSTDESYKILIQETKDMNDCHSVNPSTPRDWGRFLSTLTYRCLQKTGYW